MPPFKLGFDRVGSFSRKARNMPLVLLGDDGLATVRTLHQALVDAMTRAAERRRALHAAPDAAVRRPPRRRAPDRAHHLDRARIRPRAQPDRPEPARGAGAPARCAAEGGVQPPRRIRSATQSTKTRTRGDSCRWCGYSTDTGIGAGRNSASTSRSVPAANCRST